MPPLTVNIPTFCDICGIKRSTAYKLINSGQVDVVKVGRRTLITHSSINALIIRGVEEARRLRVR